MSNSRVHPRQAEKAESRASALGVRRRPRPARRHVSAAVALVGADLLAAGAAIAMTAALLAIAAAAGVRVPGLMAAFTAEVPVMLLLMMALNGLIGLYRKESRSHIERFRLRCLAMLLFVFIEGVALLRTGPMLASLTTPVVGFMFLTFGCWLDHLAAAWLMRACTWSAGAVILGDRPSADSIAALLASHPDWGLEPVGFLPAASPEAPIRRFDEQKPDGASAADVLIVPASERMPGDAQQWRARGFKRVVVMNDCGASATIGAEVRSIYPYVAIELGSRRPHVNSTLKRAIDLTLAVPFAIVTAPVVLVLAICIKAADHGPAFYTQPRLGWCGRTIAVRKLRTMYRDADDRLRCTLQSDPSARDEWQRYYKLSHDPRILPGIGTLLRRTSLDELPQLWNVIRGDMSLVGPRPFPAYHLQAFDAEFQKLRSSVPPGLTGLWQVSSRSEGNLEVQQAEDSFYIQNRSLWLDLYILLATLPAILNARGAK